MDGGFSFASVILSYFLVAGGIFTSMLAAGYMKVSSDIAVYVMFAVGGFIGGFVAARASKGSTIIEPAIGAIAVIGTIVGLVAGSEVGKAIWGSSETMKVVVGLGVSPVVGAIVGALVSEKFFGEATLSPFPWIIYGAFSTFGACVLATLIVGLVAVGHGENTMDALAKLLFAGMGIGCFLSGLAIGASARSRPLGASFLAGAIGVAGYGLLVTRGSTSSDAAAGIAVIAAGGAIVTLIGTLIGWAAVGKKTAG
jgi:hypothetical protein